VELAAEVFQVKPNYKVVPKGILKFIAITDKNFKSSTPDTFIVSSNLIEFVNELKKKNEKDIWLIGGGKLIASFLEYDLLDSMILTLIPTTIGEGIYIQIHYT
jgi:dihydrofolate reductase